VLLTCKEIFRLADIHPEALQVERVQLLVGSNGGENFLFD